MEKIIFLDIDGVLNSANYIDALYRSHKECEEIEFEDKYGDLFFPHNCEALKKIIDKTKANIVISSTWRMAGLSEMKSLWKHRKLAGKIVGVTPSEFDVLESGRAPFYDATCRGMEIELWIKRNNFKGRYVIIDDVKDMLEEQQPYFILTNEKIGLTFKDADRAIQILNNK